MSFQTYLTAALAVSLGVWKDTTPTTKFPPIKELLKIELGRVLATSHVLKKHGFRPSPRLRSKMLAEPWEVDISDLLSEYLTEIEFQKIDSMDLAKDLLEYAPLEQFGLPPKTKSTDSFDKVTRDISKVLKGTDPIRASALALEKYTAIHSCLSLR